ncbi:MAG: acyl-CoA dehydrogenase family protein [Actinobacteria bacterium]|nr:acyl-CoA dehydrogenase family protein [Actinomycetota bacterium]
MDQAGFFQDAPRLRDEWEDDHALRAYLERVVPADVLAEITPSLTEMGHLAANELRDLAVEMNRRDNEPRLVHFDAWGRRVDRIETAPAWGRIGAYAARHGVVATAYEDAHGAWSRLHQMALAYLFNPSSALYSCPLAMTDGAARTLLDHGEQALIDRAVPHLTSRDPATAWTSGQWMTERTGGSDVGLSETTATKDGWIDDRGLDVWRLHGTKWFTSAITSEMALTLARPEGNPGGGRGLAMYYVETHWPEPDGPLNDLRVLRLKDKLGTRQMPTAELALDGTIGFLVGGPSDGTRNIVPMLQVTRLWNAVSAASGIRRGLALARDFARRRVAFGRALADQPLHQVTLADLRVEHEAALQLTFRAVELFGRAERGEASDEERQVLRMLLPVAKLVTGKQAVAAASEALEAFGGAGYIEDTHLPVLLRDAQVLPIWEGTTNVLSLDTLRALARDGALPAYRAEIADQAERSAHPDLASIGRAAIAAADHAAAWVARALEEGGLDAAQHGARRFAVTLGRAHTAVLLAAQAQHDLERLHDGRGLAVARRYAARGLDLIVDDADPVGDAALARDEALPG